MSTIIKNFYDKYQQNKLLIFLSVLFLISVAAGSLVLYKTRGGIFVGADSTNYIVPARNLLLGKGFGLYTAQGQFEFLQRFPPFYPMVYYFIGLFGLDMMITMRWINIILFAFVVFLSGLSFWIYSRSFWQSILMSGLIAFAKCLIDDYSWAMSESFYFFFIILSLLFLIRFLQKGKKTDLIILGFISALLFLDRLAGITNISAIFFAIMIFSGNGFWQKLKRAISYLFISFIPMVIWIVIVDIKTKTLLGRPWLTGIDYQQRFNDMKLWFEDIAISWIPNGNSIYWISDHHYFKPFWITIITALIVSSLLLFFWITKKIGNRWKENRVIQLLSTNVLFILIHVVILFLTNVLIGFGFARNARNFSPFYFYSIIIFVSIIYLIGYINIGRKVIHAILITGSLIVLSFVVYHGVRGALASPADGFGYYTVNSRSSKLIKLVREFPHGTPIITNKGTYLLFHTNRQAYVMQEQFQLEPDWTFPRFGDSKTEEAQIVFVKTNAALVIVDNLDRELSWLYGDQTEARIEKLTEGLYLYYQGPDGAIYFYSKPNFP